MTRYYRTLDLRQLWHLAAARGITPKVLADRTGVGFPDDGTRVSLHDLTADQLVATADVLGVTVDELLTRRDAPDTTESGLATRDARMLHAALVRFGDLTEHQILTVLGWSPERMTAAIARLRRHLDSSGITLRRNGHRLELDTAPDTPLGPYLTGFAAARADRSTLTGDLAVVLLIAVRAHALHDGPGPPSAPWHIADALAACGAVQPPGDRTHTAQRVPLVPHPDLLFALAMTDEPPAPATG